MKIKIVLTLLLLCGFAGAQSTFCSANHDCTVTGAWTFSGPMTLPSVTLFRGRIDATKFTGADMCAKVNAAWTYAVGLGLGYGEVDATGFHGRQDVAGSCFTSFPANATTPKVFNGMLKLAPDVKIVSAVTQNPPSNIIIDGGSAWIWPYMTTADFAGAQGAMFMPSDTFDWATQKAVLTLGYSGGGATNPRGVWLQNIGVDCLSPNGTYHSGSIGIYNGVAQENTGGDGVTVYGCTRGIDIEVVGSIGGAQNSGPWKRLNIQANGVPTTETAWIGFDYCSDTLSSMCKTNRGIDGATFTGPIGGAASSVAVSINASNFAVRNTSIEETQYGVELGRYHAALGVTLDNINGQGHTDFNMTAVVHIVSGSTTAFNALNISSNQQQRSDYVIQDEGTGGLSLCGQSSVAAGSPCFGATLITPAVMFYSCSNQIGYGASRTCIWNTPAAASNMSITGNAATATTSSACPTCTGGVFIQTSNTDYTTASADKGKLIRMTPAANNVTFNLPATPPSATWWVVVQSVNLTGFTTSINSNGTNVDGSPTSTTPITVAQGQNLIIWTNGTSYYTTRYAGTYSGTTGSIGGGALAAGACASGTVTISGVVAGQTGRATATDGTDQDNYIIKAYASAANTATVKVCAIAAGTPTAKTYAVRISP